MVLWAYLLAAGRCSMLMAAARPRISVKLTPFPAANRSITI